MVINQAAVIGHNMKWTELRRVVTREWNSFQRSFCSMLQNARLFRKLRAACPWHHRAFEFCVSIGERCLGKISCICGEPAIPALVPSKDRNQTHTACSRIGRLIDNVSEGAFYSVLSIQDISPLHRMRFQPQVLWQIWNRCWQVHDGGS